jgi:TonB family protein
MDEGNGWSGLASAAARAFRSALVIGCFLSLVLTVAAIDEGQRFAGITAPPRTPAVQSPAEIPRVLPSPPPQLTPDERAVHPLLIIPPRSHRFDRSGETPTRHPDLWPVIIHKVEPEYTESAKRARVSGIVIVEVIIEADGKISGGHILKPLPFGLDQKAIEAVRQWRFRPGTVDGKPVPVITNLRLNFRLPEKRQ